MQPQIPTAKEIAEATGVSADTARGWLSGRGNMPVKALSAIRKACPWIDIERLVEMIEERQISPVDLRSKGCRKLSNHDNPSVPRRRSVRERRGLEFEVE